MKYLLLLLLPLSLRSQTESIYLHLDKTVCYPGDTVRFRGYIFNNNGPSPGISTNLIVELWQDSAHLLARKIFPIISSVSAGQIEFPPKPGLYWLRAYTQYSFGHNVFFQSLTVCDADNPIITRSFNHLKEVLAVDTGDVSFLCHHTKKGLGCLIIPREGSRYNDREFKFSASYYGTPLADNTFTLNKSRQRSLLIDLPDLNGYVDVTFSNSDTVVAKGIVYIPPKRVNAELIKDTGAYRFIIDDTTGWNCSVSVTDADVPNPAASIADALSPPYVSKAIPDSAYLSFEGVANKELNKSKLIKSTEMVAIIQQDSASSMKVISIDSSGHFDMHGLYFFDTAWFNFQLNTHNTGGWDKSKNIRLTFLEPKYPKFIAPDSNRYYYDTIGFHPRFATPDYDTLKYLKPVTVRAQVRDKMDNVYTTGMFHMPSPRSYDLRDDYGIKKGYFGDIWDYLRAHCPGFMMLSDNPSGRPRPKVNGKDAIIYVDEQLMNWEDVVRYRIREFAYCKVFTDFWVDDSPGLRAVSGIGGTANQFKLEGSGALKLPVDDQLKTVIAIYTRKGDDFHGTSDGLNRMPLVGYSKVRPFTRPDRVTLQWIPYIEGNHFKVAFSNPFHVKRFRFIIEGVNKYGEVLHFEKIME